MKILIDARMVEKTTHGIARYTLNLMAGLWRLGHQVEFLCKGEEGAETVKMKLASMVSDSTADKLKLKPMTPIYTKLRFAHPLETLELTSIIKPKNYDIVHYTSFSVPLMSSKNMVITIHDLTHLHMNSSFAQKIYYHSVVRTALPGCGQIIAVSQWTKDDMVRLLKANPEKITVIPNGMDQRWFEAEEKGIDVVEPEFREKNKLSGSYIACVANSKRHKNVQTLISACERLWMSGCEFQLALLLGTSTWPKDLKLSEAFRSKIVLMHGLTETELMSVYKFAQFTVCPSRFEGYSFPVAESLMMGTRVVLSRASAHKEFIDEKLYFYEPYDDVNALKKAMEVALKIKNSDERKIVQHGRPLDLNTRSPNIISNHDMVLRTEAVYQKILNSY